MSDLTDHHRLSEPVLVVAQQDAHCSGFSVGERDAEVEDVGDEPSIGERASGEVVG